MEFMAEHFAARGAERTIALQPRAAIAEMQLALREGRFESEQAGHRVPDAVGILEPAPQHHVAAALAVDRNETFGQCAKSFVEVIRRRQRTGMKFRKTAWQPDRIGGGIGRLIGQWRKRNDFRTCAAPLPQTSGPA